MSRPVTLFTIQWGDLSLEEVCKLAKQMGYEGLELSAAHLDMKRAATDPKYVEEVKATLKKYDLGCWALSNHLAGQCVCDTLPDAYDSRLDGFAPASLAGKPEEIQKWAIDEMKVTAHAAKAMGVKVVTFFMGSPIWKFWYSFPQTSEEQIEAAYQEAEQTKGQPTMILAKTVKGKGVSFMENNAGWHGKAPNDEQWAQAKAELEAQIKELEG